MIYSCFPLSLDEVMTWEHEACEDTSHMKIVCDIVLTLLNLMCYELINLAELDVMYVIIILH
jgi:hypothetical protein